MSRFPLVPKLSAQAERLGTHLPEKLRFIIYNWVYFLNSGKELCSIRRFDVGDQKICLDSLFIFQINEANILKYQQQLEIYKSTKFLKTLLKSFNSNSDKLPIFAITDSFFIVTILSTFITDLILRLFTELISILISLVRVNRGNNRTYCRYY